MSARWQLLHLCSVYLLQRVQSSCSSQAVDIDFSSATIEDNEVLYKDGWVAGGHMRIKNVGTHSGNVVDLLITTQSLYRPSNLGVSQSKNGFSAGSTTCPSGGCDFVQINLKQSFASMERFPANGGSDCNAVDLRFSFCDGSGSDTETTCSPVTLPAFAITLFDLDETETSGGVTQATEQFYISGYSSYVLSDGDVDTAICVLESDGSTTGLCSPTDGGLKSPPQRTSYGSSMCVDANSRTMFLSTEKGVNSDNPNDKDDLTDEQLSRSVMLNYESVSSFDITYEIMCNGCNTDGRNFLFSGAAQDLINL